MSVRGPEDEPIHVLMDGAQSPDWNMAVDDALLALRQAGTIAGTWVRLFAWRPPAISIGRLQSAGRDLDFEALERDRVPVVRRSTGGKAVYHADELTYSLIGAVPDVIWGENLHDTYRRVSGVIAAGLARIGVETAFAPGRPAMGKVPASLEAACFAVAYGHELVHRGRKICGSAQRRLTRAFLQHGSLLLGPDQAQIARYLQAPGDRAALAARLTAETIDVETAAGRRVSLEELGDQVIEALIERHGALVIPRAELPDAVRRAAEERRPAVRVSPGAVDSREPTG
jgi:lipoyl(octanoyl) transferase